MTELIKNCALAVDKARELCPLVHNITNYVTANDVANIELAAGASPIMADNCLETADVTAMSNALVINIGTLNSKSIDSMIIAGKTANLMNKPVVLDPVGAGASPLRNETVKRLLASVKMSVIRGNLSEMSFICGSPSNTKGVDASETDRYNDKIIIAKSVSEKFNCTAAVTGETDVVCKSGKIAEIKNGHEMLSKVTGAGCMTTGLAGVFCAVTDSFTAAITAICSMGIAGELSFLNYGKNGTASFHIGLIDQISLMTSEIFTERERIYEL